MKTSQNSKFTNRVLIVRENEFRLHAFRTRRKYTVILAAQCHTNRTRTYTHVVVKTLLYNRTHNTHDPSGCDSPNTTSFPLDTPSMVFFSASSNASTCNGQTIFSKSRSRFVHSVIGICTSSRST